MTSPDERQQKVCPLICADCITPTACAYFGCVKDVEQPPDAAPVAAPRSRVELVEAIQQARRYALNIYADDGELMDRLNAILQCTYPVAAPSDAVRALQDVAVMVNTIWDAIEDDRPIEAANYCDTLLKDIGPILAQVSQTNTPPVTDEARRLLKRLDSNSDAQDAAFDRWWGASKYCQVVIPQKGWRQMAFDAWNAALRAQGEK